MKQVKKSAIASSIGAVVIGSLASLNVNAATNPFGIQALESGYMVMAAEGSCGADKSKDTSKDMKEGKCGEGKCGGDKAKEKMKKEGKCGEGKCGGQA